jgi:hypothetical protein
MSGRLYAQQARSGYTGFAFTSPLEVSAGNDNGFLIERVVSNGLPNPLLPPGVPAGTALNEPGRYTDQVLLLTAPTVSFLKDSPRREFAVNYQPEFEIFRQNPDQNAWNHNFSAGFAYLLNRKTEIFAGDTLIATQDPARTMQVVSLLLPRSPYRENSFRLSLSRALSNVTRFELQADDTSTVFSRFDPFQSRVLTTQTTGATFALTHMFRRNQRLRASASIFRSRPTSDVGANADLAQRDLAGSQKPYYMENLAYQRMFGRNVIAEFTGGGVQGQTGNSLTWGVSADKRFHQLVIGGGFFRALQVLAGGRQFLANGLQSNDVYETAMFRLRGRISQNGWIQFNVVASRDESDIVVQRSKSLMGRLRLTRQLTDRTAVFANIETYRQNKNDFVNAPLVRNRIFFGIEYSFDPDKGNRAVTDFDKEPEYVGLPGRGRRRS